MLLLMALLHAIVLLGLSFTERRSSRARPHARARCPAGDRRGPRSTRNERAAYLAQRTQIGAGNTDQAQHVGSPASRGALAIPRSGEAGQRSDQCPASRRRGAPGADQQRREPGHPLRRPDRGCQRQRAACR